jgi:hypothetical protein
MKSTSSPTFLVALLALLAGCWIATAHAATTPRDPFNGRQSYSGSAMKCLIANDFYAVHFTAIQPGIQKGEKTAFEKYCQQVPATGKLYLTIDMLDRDVRTTPIALRVVEESLTDDGKVTETKRTLSETPGKIYKNGSADIAVDVTTAGHYALIVTVGDQVITEDDRLRIPFSVGLPAPTSYTSMTGKLTGALAFLFYAVVGVIGYRVYRVYRPKRDAIALDGRESEASAG